MCRGFLWDGRSRPTAKTASAQSQSGFRRGVGQLARLTWIRLFVSQNNRVGSRGRWQFVRVEEMERVRRVRQHP